MWSLPDIIRMNNEAVEGKPESKPEKDSFTAEDRAFLKELKVTTEEK